MCKMVHPPQSVNARFLTESAPGGKSNHVCVRSTVTHAYSERSWYGSVPVDYWYTHGAISV